MFNSIVANPIKGSFDFTCTVLLTLILASWKEFVDFAVDTGGIQNVILGTLGTQPAQNAIQVLCSLLRSSLRNRHHSKCLHLINGILVSRRNSAIPHPVKSALNILSTFLVALIRFSLGQEHIDSLEVTCCIIRGKFAISQPVK